MKKFIPLSLLILCTILFSDNLVAQGGTCSEIEPFCAGNQALIFPNCNNQDPNCTPTAEPGPDYDCLLTQPWPAWFYLQIDQSGDLDFEIIQNTAFDINGDPVGTGLDVDFICWGPFAQGADLCDYTQLQQFNEIACSYSIQPIENFTITNGQSGEIYVLLITNYDQGVGFIKLHQTNAGDPGAGSTDCSIVTTTEACDGDIVTLDATDPFAIGYEWTYENPIGSGTYVPFVPPETNPTLNVTVTGNYRAEVFYTGNSNITDYNVIFYPNPVANPPMDMFQCDDGTNTGIFDLTVNTPIILGGQDPLVFEVKYYETLLDSQNDTNEILTPTAYPIIGTSQTIYVRIHDIASGTCFDLTDFLIEFLPASAGPMTDIEVCDVDSDGFVSLDLITLKNPEALGAQDPFQFTVTYHASQADANADINPYPNPYVATAPSETIFVRVENNSNITCYATDSFVVTIFVAPTAIQPTPYIICDDLPNDGFADFDLTTKDLEITGGNPDAVVSYHETFPSTGQSSHCTCARNVRHCCGSTMALTVTVPHARRQ